MPVTITELQALTLRPVLVFKDGVPTPPEPWPVEIQRFLLDTQLAPRPGAPEAHTNGVLYHARLPNLGDKWLTTIVTMHITGMDATYDIGKTFEVSFPNDQYDAQHDDELEDLLKAEIV